MPVHTEGQPLCLCCHMHSSGPMSVNEGIPIFNMSVLFTFFFKALALYLSAGTSMTHYKDQQVEL